MGVCVTKFLIFGKAVGMAQGKPKKSHGKNVAIKSAAPPGFTLDPDGSLSFNLSSVPKSPLEFMATGFRYLRENNEVLFLFGHSSKFEDANNSHFILAVEISMGLDSVYKSLVDNVWNQPSANNELPMIESVERGLTDEEKENAATYECNKGLPPIETRSSTLRAYQADFTSTYVWGAHGGLEFITMPSSLITTWRKIGVIRDGDKPSSKLTVVMSRFLLYAFFLQVREFCKDYNHEPDHLIA